MKIKDYKEFKHSFVFNDASWEYFSIVSNVVNDCGERMILDQQVELVCTGSRAVLHGNLRITPEKLRKMADELEELLKDSKEDDA